MRLEIYLKCRLSKMTLIQKNRFKLHDSVENSRHDMNPKWINNMSKLNGFHSSTASMLMERVIIIISVGDSSREHFLWLTTFVLKGNSEETHNQRWETPHTYSLHSRVWLRPCIQTCVSNICIHKHSDRSEMWHWGFHHLIVSGRTKTKVLKF